MSREDIKAMARDIVGREGGWVDDPNDKGGATKYGVSLRYARRLGLDLDHDGDTDADDIRLVSPEQAAELYIRDFFDDPGFGGLPEILWAPLFDFAVNAGPARALMCLQEVVNEVAQTAPDVGLGPLKPDGRMGPKTRAAVQMAHDAMGGYLTDALVERRIAYYRSIVARDPSQRRFLAGWINRANAFLTHEGNVS